MKAPIPVCSLVGRKAARALATLVQRPAWAALCITMFLPASAFCAGLPVLNTDALNLHMVETRIVGEVPCFGGSPSAMGTLTAEPGFTGYVVVLKGEVSTPGTLLLNIAGFSALYRNPDTAKLDMSYPDAVCISQEQGKGAMVLASFENVDRKQRVQYYRNDLSRGPLYIRLAFFLPEGIRGDIHVTAPIFIEN